MRLELLRHRVLRLFGLSVISQMAMSLTSFVAGLLLIRHASDHDYGYYVLAQSAVLLAVTITGSGVCGPLAVLAPKRDAASQADMMIRVERDQRRWLIRIAPLGLVLAVALRLLGWVDAEQFWVLMAAGPAMWLAMHRDLLRSMLMIRSNLNAVFRADMSYAAALLLLVGLACLHWLPAAPVAVTGFTLGALLASLLAYRSLDLPREAPPADPAAPGPWRDMLPLGIWATVGAMIYWLFAQGYNSVLAIQLDAAAVAAVSAVRLLLMPTYVLTSGVQGLLIPMSARWLHERGLGVVIRRLLLATGAILAMNLAYFAVLWLARDWVSEQVLKKIIPQRDEMILLWGVTALLFVIRDLLQSGLIALGEFRRLAWLSAAGAVAALATMWVAIDRIGMSGALYGLIVGEGVNLVGTVALLWRAALRERHAPGPAAASG